MPITLVRNEEHCLIRLEGEVNIASAGDLKQVLLEALASGQELRVDLERAVEPDISTLQLLWAAEREARGAGIGFVVAGALSAEITGAVLDAGLAGFLLPANSDGGAPDPTS